MLDRRTDKLLKKLNLLCNSGGFCILESEELLFDGEDDDSIKGMLGYLEDRKYLDMRYAEEGEYCIRLLPEGRLYSECEHRERETEKKRQKTLACCSALGAFFGALIGGGIVILIALFAF